MELIQFYITNNYHTLFLYTKKLWNESKVAATPDMAQMIESRGIDRFMHRDFVNVTLETKQEFYKSCLAILIQAIDSQAFDKIQVIFDMEENIKVQPQDEILERA